jgi:hypothetical protein
MPHDWRPPRDEDWLRLRTLLRDVMVHLQHDALDWEHPEADMRTVGGAAWSVGLGRYQEQADRARELATWVEDEYRALEGGAQGRARRSRDVPGYARALMLRGPFHNAGPDGLCEECHEPFLCPTGLAIYDSIVPRQLPENPRCQQCSSPDPSPVGAERSGAAAQRDTARSWHARCGDHLMWKQQDGSWPVGLRSRLQPPLPGAGSGKWCGVKRKPSRPTWLEVAAGNARLTGCASIAGASPDP